MTNPWLRRTGNTGARFQRRAIFGLVVLGVFALCYLINFYRLLHIKMARRRLAISINIFAENK
jgi:hypothetical protein